MNVGGPLFSSKRVPNGINQSIHHSVNLSQLVSQSVSYESVSQSVSHSVRKGGRQVGIYASRPSVSGSIIQNIINDHCMRIW